MTPSRFRRVPFLLRFVAALVPLLLGCQLVDRALTGVSSGSFSTDRDQTVFLVGNQPRTLDPARTLGGPDGPLGHVFSGLVTLNTDLQVQPDLAGGWTISEDGLVYTFYLRRNAVFHDGRPVTAADVVFSWERAADPATGSDTASTYLGDMQGFADRQQGVSERISGLRAVDDHTLEVTLDAPVVYFLAKLAYPVAFVVDQNNVSAADWEHRPNGTGPFLLSEWRDDSVIVLERNDLFYRDPARIARVVYDLGAGLPLSMYENGEIDLVGIGGGSLERAQDPNDPLAADLRTGVSMCTTVVGLNNSLAPFDDVRVRQAFNYALDKDLLIEAFSGGSGLPSVGALPPGMPGYRGSNPGYPYNPEKARQLLAEAGYPDGAGLPPLTFSTSGYGDVGAYVEAVITMWQEALNVTIEPEMVDPFLYFDELHEGRAGHFFSSGWCADYPDPQNFLDILYHSQSQQNIGRFADRKIDDMLEAARVETDVPSRLALYGEIEDRLIEAAPVVFVSHSLSAVLVKPRLQGYVLTPIGVPQWHLVSLVD